jgi:hypothetical protein
MTHQQTQPLFDLPKVTAVGIASPLAAVLTSRFGVAGTLIGMAVTAVIVTAVADFLKVYLQRVPGAVTSIPGGFRKRPRWQNVLIKLRLPFSKFSSLSPERRRSILIGSAVASVISFLIGIAVLTGVELGVGKSLTCWVWNECSAEATSDDGSTSGSTLGAAFPGSQNQAPPTNQPSDAKQELPSQQDVVPGSEQPALPQPDQGRSPSGVAEDSQGTPLPEDQQLRKSDQISNGENEGGQNEAPALQQVER